jgi:hypothetical protein
MIKTNIKSSLSLPVIIENISNQTGLFHTVDEKRIFLKPNEFLFFPICDAGIPKALMDPPVGAILIDPPLPLRLTNLRLLFV